MISYDNTIFYMILFILGLFLLNLLCGILYFFLFAHDHNPFYRFRVDVDSWDESIIISTKDEKYYCITLICFWLVFIIFYNIPKGFLKLLYFTIDYINWGINKIKNI